MVDTHKSCGTAFPYKGTEKNREGWRYVLSKDQALKVFWPGFKAGQEPRIVMCCGDTVAESMRSNWARDTDLKGSLLLCPDCAIENGLLW